MKKQRNLKKLELMKKKNFSDIIDTNFDYLIKKLAEGASI